MKSQFSGYYPPTEAEYEKLWKEATIVLDTNVLLNLYRLPATARDELFSVLETLKSRIWVPHQVALEFQRRRLTVIASEQKSTEAAKQSASALVEDFKNKVEALQIDKQGIGVDPMPLLENLEKANEDLINAINSAHKEQLDISTLDHVRERLDKLLAGCVGVGPTTQKDLDALINDGDDRYRERIPPGFGDIEKDKNPNEATFIHDQIKYPRKFGDLILWRQLIEKVKTSGIKVVLLVTADKKEDWWWREQGKTIGPHPQLVREIMREGEVDLYWMYSPVQFVEHANKYTATTISTQSVDELKHVTSAPQTRFEADRDIASHHEYDSILRYGQSLNEFKYYDRPDPRYVEEAVGDWLRQNYRDVHKTKGFPDFVVTQDDEPLGFEVKVIKSINERIAFSSSVVSSLLKGYLETSEGRLSNFTLILVIQEEAFFEFVNNTSTYALESQLAQLLGKYPITEIMVGSIINERFEPLIRQRERHYA